MADKYCLICGEKATWFKFGYAYCEKHISEDADDFDPEEHEMDVINLFKYGYKKE